MSTAPSASPEVLAVIKEFKERLLPAKLKDTVLNGQLLAVWCNAHKGGVASAENMYEATKSIYASLEWDVPPAVLVRDQNENRVNVVVPAFKQNDEFAAKIKAGEVADAKKKKDVDARKQIESVITAFQPIKDGRIQYGLQAAQQERLRRYVAQETARNADPTSILEQVRKEIARLYSVAERAVERL